MKTLLATNYPQLNRYILTTHQDFLFLAVLDSKEECLKALTIYEPELIIFSDCLKDIEEDLEKQLTFINEVKKYLPEAHILFLFTKITLGPEQQRVVQELGIFFLYHPFPGQKLNQILYRISDLKQQVNIPNVVAIWSPKPGDGASLTAEAVSHVLYKNRTEEQKYIGLVDFNILRPYLKYRLGLDNSTVIDKLLPYIAAGSLTPDILLEYAPSINKQDKFRFIGGISRPELNKRYNATQFNIIMETARKFFSKTVINAGSSLDNVGTITALKNADLIIAVVQPNYLSKRCFKQALSLFPALGINPNKIKLVINRYGEKELEVHVIVAGLEVEVLGILNDLGTEANIIEEIPLWERKDNKNVIDYLNFLQDILEQCGLTVPREKEKKKKLLVRGLNIC